MNCALWGPSEHVGSAELADLAERLRSLGLRLEQIGLDGSPSATTELVVINTKTLLGAARLDALPRLRLALTTTSGFDHIDLEAAAERGVRVARCPLARRDAVADCAITMALSLLRRLPLLLDQAREGHWARSAMQRLPLPLVRALTIGVVGNGVIGARVAALWRGLGARVLVSDPAQPDLPPTAQLIEQADILTLHCSLTGNSRRLIDESALLRMKSGALLINTARGECIDLAAVLSVDRLAGFGLDVFDVEPPPDLAALASRENVLITPHSAGYHLGLGRAITQEVVATLSAFLEGKTLEHELQIRSA